MDPPDRARGTRVRAAATAFLRVRPVVIGVAALISAGLLFSSSAPRAQVRALGATMATAWTLMVVESLSLRKRQVTETWLVVSLALTLLAVALLSSLAGGPKAPYLPLIAAPVTVGIAAFGRSPRGSAVLGVGVLTVLMLALLPPLCPPLPTEYLHFQVVVATITTFLLIWLAVTGLAQAHAGASRDADALRQSFLDAALARSKEVEAVGARVAHELRNPLTAVKALVELAARGESPSKDVERLAVALGEVKRMEGTLTEYLSLARPLTEMIPEPVDLADIVRATAAVIEARAAEALVAVETRVVPLRTRADPRRLREALLNLAANALDAMPRGGSLVLACEREGEVGRFVVADTGPGVPREIVARVGEPFVSGREGGTGLGLALCRSVARMHGGDLHVLGAPDGGTRVLLELQMVE